VKKNKYLLVVILLLGILLRLRNWNLGPIDAHPMRQTDAECVAYFMSQGIGSFLRPKACLMRPVTNTEGYFFLEFPVYEVLIAMGYKIFGVKNVVFRVINMFLYLVASGGLYIFVKKILGEKLALASVFLLATAPGAIFFIGHAIHPDVFAVACMMLSLGLLVKNPSPTPSLDPPLRRAGRAGVKYKLNKLISGLLLGLSVATRPFGLIVAPVYIYFLLKEKRKIVDWLLIFLPGMGIYGCWRWWIGRSGISADWENWVLTGQNKFFDFNYMKILIWKNISGEVVGRVISGLAVLGLIISIFKKDKKMLPIILWLLMVPIYWYVAFEGNLIHQYYADIYLVPVLILASVGLIFIWDKSRILALVALILIIYNGYRTSDYFFKDIVYPEKIKYSAEIRENIKPDKKIIYMVKSDPVTLSLSHRQGWMLGEWPVDVAPTIWAFMEMRHSNFDYIVEPKNSMDMKREDAAIIEQNYPLFRETESLRILKNK